MHDYTTAVIWVSCYLKDVVQKVIYTKRKGVHKMKTTKRYIALILVLCTIFSITSTTIYGVSTDFTSTTSEHIQYINQSELMPMMARGCGNTCNHYDMVYDHSENDGATLIFWCDLCGQYIRKKAG